MALGKQAKTLNSRQVVQLLSYLSTTRYPVRNRTIALLSLRAGLRSIEIANLTWAMVTDAEGNVGSAIHLLNGASKGKRGGRVIPLNRELKDALARLHAERGESPFVITSERSERTSAAAVVNMFADWYSRLGFAGCSSHSGRRSFITNAARKISTVGGSLRDVQMLAGARRPFDDSKIHRVRC